MIEYHSASEAGETHPPSHPLRATLSEEMHARKLPRLVAPARIVQYVLLTTGDEARANAERLRSGLAVAGIAFDADCRYFACTLSRAVFAWERHSEFISYTFILQDDDGDFDDPAVLAETDPWLRGLLGSIIRATHARLVRGDCDPGAIASHFSRDDLVVSDAMEGRARIWCDFRLHSDGAGRLIVQDMGLLGTEGSQLLQRLQELGNYRKLALLGLPVAQSGTPILSLLEHRLAELTVRIAGSDSDDEALLMDLSVLSADLARMATETGYRMSATRAYAEICADRLRSLTMVPVQGYVSFDDFTERRLLPAMRTCEAFSRRLDELSRRAGWTSALLRTRVDTALGRRNRDLLASMDQRTALQLRLQHTVEGLSVVAVSYYGTGLWHYLRAAFETMHINPPAWIDIFVIPGIVLSTWLAIRALKRRAHQPRKETRGSIREGPAGAIPE